MRNLKRALSLAVAAVMLIGMMVVGAGAASLSDFPDAGDITHGEAAAVISGLEIMMGDANGFRPNDTITRAEMATVILKMLYGANVNASIYGGLDIFDDCDGHWAKAIVNMAYSQGIISGVGDNKFDPDAQVTVAEAATMLVKALGISCPGASWPLNVMSKASELKLFGDLNVTANMPMIRDNIAVLCLEGLQYSPSGTGGYKVGDYTFDSLLDAYIFSGGDPELIDVVPAADSLGSRVFGLSKDPDVDDFGHAISVWTANNGMEVEVPGVSAALVYTSKSTAVATDLRGCTVAPSKKNVITNGAPEAESEDASAAITSASNIQDLTGNGKVVEVYLSNRAVTKVIVTEYTVGTLNISAGENPIYTVVTGLSAASDKVVLHGDVAKDDVVTAVKANDVLHIYPTTQIVGVQTAYNTSSNTITVDGTVYGMGKVRTNGSPAYIYVAQPTTLGGEAKNFYLDQYGYVVHSGEITPTASTNYAQIQGTIVANMAVTVDGTTPHIQARFVMGDGSVGVYNIKATQTDEDWFLLGEKIYDHTANTNTGSTDAEVQAAVGTALTARIFGYTLDGSTITLEALESTSNLADGTVVAGATATTAYTGATSQAVSDSKTALITAGTVFVLYDSVNNTAVRYVGPASLPKGTSLTAGEATIVMTGTGTDYGVASVVFGAYSAPAAGTAGYVYIDYDQFSVALDGDNTPVRTYAGIAADGNIVTVTGPNAAETALNADGVYSYKDDGTVTRESLLTGATTTKATGAAQATVYNESLITVDGTNYYSINEDTKVAYVGSDLTGMNGNICIVVYKDTTAQTIFVIEAAPTPCVHDWSDWVDTAGTHTRTCNLCQATETHSATLSGQTTLTSDSTNGQYTHTGKCTATGCTLDVTEDCDGDWDAESGKKLCDTCDAVLAMCNHDQGTTWEPGDATTQCAEICDVCGHVMNSHDFVDSNDDGTCDTAHS